MMRLISSIVLVLTHAACAATPSTQPHPALSYAHEIRQDPPLHLHLLTVDLANPDVSIVVRTAGADPDGDGPWQTTLLTARSIAQRDKLAAAVNGDFFSPRDAREILGRKVPYFDGNPARVIGWAMSDGKVWGKPINNGAPALMVLKNRQVIVTDQPTRFLEHAWQVVSGGPMLVRDGRCCTLPRDKPAPRTAVGLTRERTKMVLLVADGRRPDYSAGLSLPDVAAEMLRLGCDSALNLDGGGSSTMALRQSEVGPLNLMNRPSDGHDFVIPLSVERPVAGVLGVRVAPGK